MRKKVAKKIPYRVTILSGLVLLVFIFCVLFGVISFFNFKRENREIALKNAEYSAERVVSIVNDKMDNLWQYYLKATSDEDIVYALEHKIEPKDYDRYMKVQQILSDASIFGNYINSYALINYKTSNVISSKGMFKISELVNKDEVLTLYEKNNYSLDKNFWYYDPSEPVSKLDKDYRVRVDLSGFNIALKLPNYTARVYGMLLVNINRNVWEEWIKSMIDNSESIVVLDSAGTLIYTTDISLYDNAIKSGCFEADSEKRIVKSDEGRDYVFASRESDVLGFHYYVLRDINSGNTSTSSYDISTMLIFIFVILAGFFLVAYFLYLPVGNLVRNIENDEGESIIGNELDFLESSIKRANKDRKILADTVSDNKKKVKELFEFRVIRGEVRGIDEWEEYFQGLEIDHHKYFATAVMVLNLKGEFDQKSNLAEDEICIKMVENLPEELNRLTWMPLVYNSCTMFCIFGMDDETELLDNIMAFYSDMQKYSEEQFGLRILMGISATHSDYRSMYSAYRESVNALTLGRDDDKNEECRFYLSKMTERVETFNTSFEDAVKNAVRATDKEQAYKAIDDFSNYLGTLASLDDQNYVTMRMIDAILEAAKSMGLEFKNVFLDGIRVNYREMLSAVEPSRVRRYLKRELIDPILKARNHMLEDSSQAVVEKLENLIDSMEGEISLTECAEKLGVHPTYIWKVLKMERDMSFGEFIEANRVKRAKNYLLHSNMSVADISDKLGYANAQTFTRVFTKETGLSPSKFRKLY